MGTTSGANTKYLVLLLLPFSEFGASIDHGECHSLTVEQPPTGQPGALVSERPLSISKEANLLHGQKVYIPQSSVMKRVGIFTDGTFASAPCPRAEQGIMFRSGVLL